MKTFTVEFQNISTKTYIPVVKRTVVVKAENELSAKNVFNSEFKNTTGKKYEILEVNEVKEELTK